MAVDNWNSAADAAYRQGQLKSPMPNYYLAATTRPDVYVNTFGLGAALLGLPVYALLDLFVELESDRFWWWHGGALHRLAADLPGGGVRVPGGARPGAAAAGAAGGAGGSGWAVAPGR